MEDLLNCHGKRFTANINGTKTSGVICVEGNNIFLCQNNKSGTDCKTKFGYRYSWSVGRGTENDLRAKFVTNLKTLYTKKDIEEYRNWQVEDKIVNKSTKETGEVIFRSGKLVIFEYIESDDYIESDTDERVSFNYTCDELHDLGWRLDEKPIEEKPETIVLTMDEIAKKFNIPVEQLKIKK
jgi:hypothetical protein